ncbi:MAG: hypothetical protein RBS78_00840 [Coriobacteriia bacterium]|jgi:hypothetical protein|nr:hypothetical protein [Coriobacteriia bacterium]
MAQSASSEINHRMAEYSYSIQPVWVQGEVRFIVTELHMPLVQGQMRNDPRQTTQINGITSESQAQDCLAKLKANRRRYIEMYLKYGGLVL